MTSHLPEGARLEELTLHEDARGDLAEIFRANLADVPVRQWTMVRSRAGALRGAHVHLRRWDVYVVASGASRVGLYDARRGSPTEGMSAILELDAERPARLLVPPGVVHAFQHAVPSITLYGMSYEWDPAEELGCHPDDPQLGMSWDAGEVVISERDATAVSLAELLDLLEPHQPLWPSEPGTAPAATAP